MIADNNKELARKALNVALKNGCQAARIVVSCDTESSFDLRDGEMENLQQSSENSLSAALFVNGRFGTCSSNRLDFDEVEKLIKNGIDSTRFLAKDQARTLADDSLIFRGGSEGLDLYDRTLTDLKPEDKIELARGAAEEIIGKDDRIISVSTNYTDGEDSDYRIMSNGFEGESEKSYFSLSASVSMQGEGEARPSNAWNESSLFFNDMIKKGVGEKALQRTLRMIGQRKTNSGNYAMVVDAMNASQLLSPLLTALYGQSLHQKNSFLIDKLGERIGSDKLTLIDEPHIPRTYGSRYFDYEGVATKRRSIFNKGVLDTYYIDTYAAHKMSVEPTISGPSVLMMEKGDKDMNGLMAVAGKGILVTGFNGGNCNSSTGDFSYGIEGFLFENGKCIQPVSEMNITGNMLQLWSSLVETGNDPRKSISPWKVPSLLFEGVAFSGL